MDKPAEQPRDFLQQAREAAIAAMEEAFPFLTREDLSEEEKAAISARMMQAVERYWRLYWRIPQTDHLGMQRSLSPILKLLYAEVPEESVLIDETQRRETF